MVLVQPLTGDSMKFKRIISLTLKELFIEEIETQILSGTLAIGEKLPPEREIAQQMQISRSVVNDGIVEMAKKGFLTIIPRQGTYVADFKKYATADILVSIMKHGSLSHDYILSTLEIRKLFMCYALEGCIERIDGNGFERMKQICHDFYYSKTAEEGSELLYNFDHCIAEYSGNLLVPILFSSFKIPNVMLLARYLRLYGKEKMHDRNMKLLQCIERKDCPNAIAIMRHSIEETIHGTTEIYNE